MNVEALQDMELSELQRLCKKFGLFEDQFDSPFLAEIVKRHAMVSRLKRFITDDSTDKMGEDENGEKYLLHNM